MALTVTTDLTVLSTAEAITNWVSYGSGGAGAMAIEPDFFVQGANCISRGVSGTTRKGMCYNHAAGIDFTTGTHEDKLVYIWMRTSTPGLCNTRANGGQTIVLGSGITTPGDAAGVWSMWYVDGSDSIIETDGFTCYVIDPQSTPTTTFGGGVALTAVTYFGGTQLSTTTAKGQNFGIDQVAYGRGEIYVSGTVATAGEGFKEIAAVAYDSAKTNRWGIINLRAGILYVRGKIILGHGITNASANWTVAVSTNVVTVQTITPHNLTTNSVFSTNASWTNNTFMQSLSGITVASIPTATSFTFALTQGNQGATTETNTAANIGANITFSSRSETVVFETPSYYNGTNVVKAIPDASVGSIAGVDGKTSYLGLAYRGGSGTTTIDFGVLVGTESGRSGSNFEVQRNPNLTTPSRTLATVTVVGDSTMALSLYSSTFKGFEGQMDFTGTGVDDDDCFAVTFDSCGRVDSNMEIRNSFFLNSVAAITDGAYIWTNTTNLSKCVFANNSRAIVFESTSGTPFTFERNVFSGNTFDIRNESGGAITITVVLADNPTYENIGGGSATTVNQGVTLTITVLDVDKNPIQNAQTSIYTPALVELMNEDTNASGIATESFNYSSPQDIIIKSRKSATTDNPRYKPFSTTGQITATGFSLTITLQVNTFL